MLPWLVSAALAGECPTSPAVHELPTHGEIALVDGVPWFFGHVGTMIGIPLGPSGQPSADRVQFTDVSERSSVRVDGDRLLFVSPRGVTAVARDGERIFRAAIPGPPSASTMTVIAAPRADGQGYGVVWQQLVQRPDQPPGHLYGVLWYAELDRSGAWKTDPVELPGRGEREGANLGYESRVSQLVPVADGFVVPWALWGFEDPSVQGALLVTHIGPTGPTTERLEPKRADTQSVVWGDQTHAIAFTTVRDARDVKAAVWIEHRGERLSVELEGSSPRVAMRGDELWLVRDAPPSPTTATSTLALGRIDLRNGNVREERWLPSEERGWQASTAIVTTDCGALIPFFGSGEPYPYGVWFEPLR